MIIDSHEHLMFPTTYQIKELEKAGVDKAILFCTTPHPERANNLEELCKEMNSLYQILSGLNTKSDNMKRLAQNNTELAQVIQKYPYATVIFGHMGGYNWMKLVEFARTAPNAYLDLSATFSTLAVRIAITELPDNCLYASDAPYGNAYLSRQLIEYLSPTEEVANKVLGNNILKIIGEIS